MAVELDLELDELVGAPYPPSVLPHVVDACLAEVWRWRLNGDLLLLPCWLVVSRRPAKNLVRLPQVVLVGSPNLHVRSLVLATAHALVGAAVVELFGGRPHRVPVQVELLRVLSRLLGSLLRRFRLQAPLCQGGLFLSPVGKAHHHGLLRGRQGVAVLGVPSPLMLVLAHVLDHGSLSLVPQVLVGLRRLFVPLQQGLVCRWWLELWLWLGLAV